MNYCFLPSFFDYLQNQPALGLIQTKLLFVEDAESTSISAMLLTMLLLLSTVEGVILFLTTFYSWCLFPGSSGVSLLYLPVEEYPGEVSAGITTTTQERRRRRRRRMSSHGGQHHLFWWMDIDYDYEEDDDDEDESENNSLYGSDSDDNDDDHNTTVGNKRVSRKVRIDLSLQEQAYSKTQFEGCCAICLIDFESNDMVVSGSQPCCRSGFHRRCLEQWLTIQNSCPCCRTPLLLRNKELLSKRMQEQVAVALDSVTREASAMSSPSRRQQEDEDQHTTTNSPADAPDWTRAIFPELTVSAESWDQFWLMIF